MNSTKFKQFVYILIIFSLIFSIFQVTTPVQAAQSAEDNSGAVICSPDAYLQTPDDCVPLGPSQYLTDMARIGIQLPIRPLNISRPDPSLADLPYNYYRIDHTGTAFYPSLDAAANKQGANLSLAPGAFFYVVYTQRLDTKYGTYFLLPNGEYMPGDGSTVSISTPFPGIEVHSTPTTPFGFVYNPTPVRKSPNELSVNPPIRQLKIYDIIQIYQSLNVEGNMWDMIGPDEWVVARDIAAVIPNTTPPDGVTNNRWIDVNLEQQTLAVYDHDQMVYATVVATGLKPLYTRPGLFPIYKKLELETMSGERGTDNFYYLENVPWTMYFDSARALHGAYWRARMGYAQSHGCVNLTPGDAHWLFNWANQGDQVWVHDPSGQTPTDPSFYGDGGA